MRLFAILSAFFAVAVFTFVSHNSLTSVLHDPSVSDTTVTDDAIIDVSLVSLESESDDIVVADAFFEPLQSPSPVTVLNRPIKVTERQFSRLSSQGLVLVKFGAPWCGPCRKIVPELETLAANNGGSLTVLSVNIDDEKQLSAQFGVQGIPSLMLMHNGNVIEQWTGYSSAASLQQRIDRAPKSSAPAQIQHVQQTSDPGQVLANPFNNG